LHGVLFRQDVLRRIGEGEVTLAFRRWHRPSVKAGGTLRTRVGVLAIESVDVVEESEVTDADARRAGAESREAVIREGPEDRPLHRVEFRLAGPDPRVALRRRRKVSDEERAEIDTRLARLDRASRHGPWTRAVLGLIAERPGTRAPDLAASMGRETARFKADVRKLKELGLTESLEVGYRLSPRGRAYYGYSGVARKRSRSRK
jgi:acyl dehydratase